MTGAAISRPVVPKPGSDSSRMLRNGSSASSCESTPMLPIQTRWISRYDGGRLSRSARVDPGCRGSCTRWNCVRIQSRENRNVSAVAGSTKGPR